MKLACITFIALLTLAWAPFARGDAPPSIDDERASAFVAGASDPSEAFSGTEGTVLFGLAAAAILALTMLLISSARTGGRTAARLDAAEVSLRGRDE